MSRPLLTAAALLLLTGCTTTIERFLGLGSEPAALTAIDYAEPWVGMNEREHRVTLKDFMGIDPVQVEWCAAFVNSVLWEAGIEHTGSLLARSYLKWGETTDEPQPGDVMVFARGTLGWQGHVGFYVDTVTVNSVDYWIVLGGNQSNAVTYDLFPVNTARLLDIRTVRTIDYAVTVSAKNWKRDGIPLRIDF